MPVVPPPPPGPPPPPAFSSPPPPNLSGNSEKGRDLLLQSIRKGKTLKKVVTNDKSAPLIQGKSNGRSENNVVGSATISRSNNLANLFADGMPKLKPVNHSQSNSLSSLPASNNSALHNNAFKNRIEIKKLAVEINKRGPPPQPPSQNQKPVISNSTSDTTLNSTPVNTHTRSVSSVSLITNGRAGGLKSKPQVAPKPPAPAPPVTGANNKRVHRAHSMRAPSSPPIVPITPQGFPALSKVGGLHASSDSLSARPRLSRPPIRAPSAKPPPPPTSAALPPPPTSAVPSPPFTLPIVPPPPTSAVPPPPPPSGPPPPPPSNPPGNSQPHRPAPPLPSNVPPQPPTRHSSIRNGHGNSLSEFESRFAYSFHSVKEFPPPQRYQGVTKVYPSKAAVAGKGQAPLPPPSTQVQLSGKMWGSNTSTC